MSKFIYDQNFYLWIKQTIYLLKNRQFDSLNIEQLIEELEYLGKLEKNTLQSNLMIFLAHLLKLTVQHDVPEEMKVSWYNSVDEHRTRVQTNLQDTPSLKTFLPEAIEKAYPKGRNLAIKEGKRAKFGVRIPDEDEYPSACPFSIAQILDENFYLLES